jgi:hypothetical protein
MAEDTHLAKAAGVTNLAVCYSPPIVNPSQEAFRTFTRSDMDVLVLGDHVIEKTEGMISGS